MPLEKRSISWPLFLGRDGGTDPKVVRQSLIEAKNVYQNTEGALGKRPGLWKGQNLGPTAQLQVPQLVAADQNFAYLSGAIANANSATANQFVLFRRELASEFAFHPLVKVFGRRVSAALDISLITNLSWGPPTADSQIVYDAEASDLVDLEVHLTGLFGSATGSPTMSRRERWNLTNGVKVDVREESGSVAYPCVYTSSGRWQRQGVATTVHGPHGNAIFTGTVTAYDVVEFVVGEVTYEVVGALVGNTVEIEVYADGVSTGTATAATGISCRASLNLFWDAEFSDLEAVVYENAATSELYKQSFKVLTTPAPSGSTVAITGGLNPSVGAGDLHGFARFVNSAGGGGFVATMRREGTAYANDIVILYNKTLSATVGTYEVPSESDLACHCWQVAGNSEAFTILRLGYSKKGVGTSYSGAAGDITDYSTWVVMRIPTDRLDTPRFGSPLFPREAQARSLSAYYAPLSKPHESGTSVYVPLAVGGGVPSIAFVKLTRNKDVEGWLPSIRYDRDYLYAASDLCVAPTAKPLYAVAGAPTPSMTETAGGSMDALGTYSYQFVHIYEAGDGRIIFGRPSTPVSITLTGANQSVTLVVRADMESDDASVVATQVYRTENAGSTYYLVGTLQYNATTDVTWVDTQADSTITNNAQIYTEDTLAGVTHDVPPPLKDMWLHDGRLWGIPADDASVLWYSGKRPDLNRLSAPAGEGPSFSGLYTLDIGPESEPLRGTSFGGTTVVFTDASVYLIGGDGPDSEGVGNFLPPQRLAAPALHEAAAFINTGKNILYKSVDSWYLVDRGFNTADVGQPVADYHRTSVRSVAMRTPSLVEILLSDGVTALVFDISLGQWYKWSYALDSAQLVQMVSQDGTSKVVARSGVQLYGEFGTKYRDIDASTAAGEYTMLAETRWFNLDKFTGFQRLYEVSLLGQWKSAHSLKLTIYYDYDDATTQTVTKVFSADPGSYIVRWQPSVQNCRSFKVRIEEVAPSGTEESFTLTGFEATIGVKGRTHYSDAETL